MDALDGRILARLVQEPLAPITSLCEDTGLTRNAVKARLDRLSEEGVLRGFMAYPNPALLGRTGVVAVVPTPDGRAPPLDAALALEDVFSVSVNHDKKLGVVMLLQDAAKLPAGLEKACGAAPERTFVQRAPPLRPPGAVLSAAQWRILEALIADPRQSHRDLADATGLTVKVVERHRRILVEGAALIVQPVVMSGVSPGATFFEMYVQGPIAAEPARVQRALGGSSWVLDRLETPLGVLLLAQADNLGHAVGALNRVLATPDVEHAELILSDGFGWARERTQAWCREKRNEMEAIAKR